MSRNGGSNVEAGGSMPNGMGGRLSPRPRSIFLLAAFLCGAAVGAGGLAVAATTLGHAGPRDGPRLALIQRIALEALDSSGATATQEAKIHDIIAATFVDVTMNADQYGDLRKQGLDLLRAPVVDAAAIESLRAGRIAKMDAISKKIANAVVDAAHQLTPAQRENLADRFEKFEGIARHDFWGGSIHTSFGRDRHPDFE